MQKHEETEDRQYVVAGQAITVNLPKEMIGKSIAKKGAKLVGVEDGKGLLPDIPNDTPVGYGDVTRGDVKKWAEGFKLRSDKFKSC